MSGADVCLILMAAAPRVTAGFPAGAAAECNVSPRAPLFLPVHQGPAGAPAPACDLTSLNSCLPTGSAFFLLLQHGQTSVHINILLQLW
jgi:hypothetical protein